MRRTADRIRHAVSFEILGLVLVTPLGSWAFGLPMEHIGVTALVSSTIAMVWTYGFNLAYDRAALRLTGSLRKTLRGRILHAALFELGLTAVLVPFIAWYLGLPLIEALAMDISLTIFYLVFAFGYNWAYDLIFPLPPGG